MLEERTVFMNGEFVAWNEARAHIMSHSFARGSAIFEVLGFHDTDQGPGVFRLDEHLKRLFRTAELLDMEIPMSTDSLHESVLETIRRNTLKEGTIKIVGYYPQVSLRITPPGRVIDISIFVLNFFEDMDGPAFPFTEGTSLCVSRWRKLDPQTVPIEAKVAANYLNGIMARKDAEARGFEHALMLDTQGFIAEGGTESVFLVHDGILMTPCLGTVLQSITRKSIIQVAKVLGVECIERRIPREMLMEADEIFLSGTPMKVLPVRKIEERPFEKVPGPLTKRFFDLMEDVVKGKDERFKDWLFPV
ncbi:MAG: branched-chain-amino-acid transaminase [Deltaproteobacteria bacterium]|nr:branched-chain-amino-acid transaminase [Deltaproteobacteria bacterium]